MKTKLVGTLIILFTFFLENSVAQDKSILAQQAWQSAEEQYESGEYSKALELLNKAEQHLGKANPPILYLKVLSNKNLFKNDNAVYNALIKDIDAFFKIADTKTYPKEKYMEIIEIKDQVEEFKKTDDLKTNELINSGSLTDVRAYIENTKNTFHLTQLQQKEVEILIASGSLDDIRAYIQSNSDSPYLVQLKQRDEVLKQEYKAGLISQIEVLDLKIAKQRKKHTIKLLVSGGLTAASILALTSGTSRMEKYGDDDKTGQAMQGLGAAGVGGLGVWFLISIVTPPKVYKVEKAKLKKELEGIAGISLQSYNERIHQTAYNGLSLKINF